MSEAVRVRGERQLSEEDAGRYAVAYNVRTTEARKTGHFLSTQR